MARNLQAVYENGVLRPLEPLDLRERQLVHVTVSDEAAVEPWLDAEYAAACGDESDDAVSLEEVRAALAKIPGSMTEDFIAERRAVNAQQLLHRERSGEALACNTADRTCRRKLRRLVGPYQFECHASRPPAHMRRLSALSITPARPSATGRRTRWAPLMPRMPNARPAPDKSRMTPPKK